MGKVTTFILKMVSLYANISNAFFDQKSTGHPVVVSVSQLRANKGGGEYIPLYTTVHNTIQHYIRIHSLTLHASRLHFTVVHYTTLHNNIVLYYSK